MSEHSSSIVRIYSHNGGVVGCGILASETRVLTTAHTVTLALGLTGDAEEKPAGQIELDFPLVAPERFIKAHVLLWVPGRGDQDSAENMIDNLAVLELEDPPVVAEQGTRVTPTNSHYQQVVDAIIEGELVPFLGAGVNLCGRPEGRGWQRGEYLPSGTELAAFLARQFSYPWSEIQELVRVSQYAALMRGSGPLYRQLRYVFDVDYPPTRLHEFFAELPGILRARGAPPYQLIVTTNYDDVLEREFRKKEEEYDLVTYVAEGNAAHRGRFLHWPANSAPQIINRANEYIDLPFDEDKNLTRTIILKIHGAVDRAAAGGDSYVITEDHYLDYLTRADISNLLPVELAGKLKASNFLFLGYSLRDWNLRVILHRIWVEQQQNRNYKSWAVQLKTEEIDRQYWRQRDVEIFDIRLEDYIKNLRDGL